MTLVFNKKDVLKQKLNAGIKVETYFPGYGSAPNDVEHAVQYFQKEFRRDHVGCVLPRYDHKIVTLFMLSIDCPRNGGTTARLCLQSLCVPFSSFSSCFSRIGFAQDMETAKGVLVGIREGILARELERIRILRPPALFIYNRPCLPA